MKRHRLKFLAVPLLLAVAGVLFAVKIQPRVGPDLLLDRSSEVLQATERHERNFGEQAMVILVQGRLPDIVLTENLGQLVGLEGCISGNKPPKAQAPGGPGSPCDELAKLKPVQLVYGPGTFINTAAKEIETKFRQRLRAEAKEAERLAATALKVAQAKGLPEADQQKAVEGVRQLVYSRAIRDLLVLGTQYGLPITHMPRIDDPQFVSALVFDPSRSATTPKARFSHLFPNDQSAVIQVRLRSGLTEAERTRALSLIRSAVEMKEWQPTRGVSYTVTGAQLVAEEVGSDLAGSMHWLLLAGVIAMALVLLLLFKVKPRLAPLLVAVSGVAATYGLMAVLGARLTVAALAVLPVVLGLGVDYAIQYQSRRNERKNRGVARALATAGACTLAGFLALMLSPMPLMRSFGGLLILGVVVTFSLTFVVSRFVKGGESNPPPIPITPGPWARRIVALGFHHPKRVLAAAVLLACIGWALETQLNVVSDPRALLPASLPAMKNLHTLEKATGVAGEVNVLIEGQDVTSPEVVRWMRRYQASTLRQFGYSAKRGCGDAELCPALALTDFFRAPLKGNSKDVHKRIQVLLGNVPPYFLHSVITEDHRAANLSFGIKMMSMERQREVIEAMRRDLKPPSGVTATMAGFPVIGTQANEIVSAPGNRLLMLAAALLAVALILALVYRNWRRVVFSLTPIVLSSGWAALVLAAIRVPLNPLSALLGTLVIAVTTEFAVLLGARFHEERERGVSALEAMNRTYASTGRAVLASGVTAIAGFAVLGLSNIPLLRDFGLVTVVDLGVALAGALIVLPAVGFLLNKEKDVDEEGEGRGSLCQEPRLLPSDHESQLQVANAN